jgi:hypothetical protein
VSVVTVKEPKTGLPVKYENWPAWRSRVEAEPLRPSCATCWGQGKVHEMSGGRLQWPPVPCTECFGTGLEWRSE